MSEKHTTRRTLDDRRQGRTDWERVDRLTEQELDESAAADEDNGLWTREQLEAAKLVLPSERTKVPVYIRMDPEVVEYFKSQGPRYQSRINAVLKSYVHSMNAADKKQLG